MDVLTNAIKPHIKGIAATIAGAFVVFLAKHNILIADDLADSIEIILGAIITGAIVWLSPKNQPSQGAKV